MSIDAGLRPAGLPAELEDLRQRVVMMGDTLLPAARAADELIDAVAAIEALKSTLDAFELQVLAELEATGAVKPFGWASTKDFCTAVIGGHRGTGPAMVRLAEDVASSRFAPVAAALRDGWLSTTKAIVITRAVNDLPSTADHERGVGVLVGEAKRLDAADCRRVGHHLLTVSILPAPTAATRRPFVAKPGPPTTAGSCRSPRTATAALGSGGVAPRRTRPSSRALCSASLPHSRPTRAIPMTARSSAAVTMDGIRVTTVPGFSTRWSRPADACRPRTCCPMHTVPLRG